MTDSAQFSKGLAEVIEIVGEFCLERFQDLGSVRQETKAPADYVSAVDREAETVAIRELQARFAGIPVVGEEGGGKAANRYWIVDPVDGTANYLSGLPIWAVSIAFVERGKPVLGAVALPALGMTFLGGSDVPLSTKGALGRIEAAGIAFGVGRNPRWPSSDRQQLETRLEARGHHVVCLGSCAASLAFVAIGRLAGYEERGVAFWDCAAGYALCRATGLEVEIYDSLIEGRLDVRARASTCVLQSNSIVGTCL